MQIIGQPVMNLVHRLVLPEMPVANPNHQLSAETAIPQMYGLCFE
jgi:hypothetical protein